MAATSRERILSTIAGEPTDHVPMAFLLCSELRRRCAHGGEYVQRQLDMGLDVVESLPGLPLEFHAEVTTQTWTEPARPNPLLHKVYHTPAGDLECIVERTADWPHGDDIPLMSDFVIPRGRKYLITCEEDVEPLKYLLAAPTDAAITRCRQGAASAREFAAAHGLATRAGFERLADMACWLCGATEFAVMGLEQPDLLGAIIDVISAWQRRRNEVVLETGPDILVKPEWYGTTFLSPTLFRRFLEPDLRQTADLAHEAGAALCYLATTNVMPFLDILKEAGVDVLFGADPVQGGWRLAEARDTCRGSICLWGGINGYLHIVDASAEEAEQAVADAIEVLGKGGGFILAPVDDVRIEPGDPHPERTAQRIRENLSRAAAAWRRLR